MLKGHMKWIQRIHRRSSIFEPLWTPITGKISCNFCGVEGEDGVDLIRLPAGGEQMFSCDTCSKKPETLLCCQEAEIDFENYMAGIEKHKAQKRAPIEKIEVEEINI